MTVAVVSANFGAYHQPSPLPPQTVNCDAVLVTDEPCDLDGWRNVVVDPTAVLSLGQRPSDQDVEDIRGRWQAGHAANSTIVVESKGAQIEQLSPRMESKVVKCRPEAYTGAEVVIWIDAQLAVISDGFVAWCLDRLGDGDLAAMRHPAGRVSILDEAAAGQGPQGRGRFTGQDTVGQARHYIADGHPERWGLWWTMILVRRMTPQVKAMGAQWLHEQQAWSTHDQVSFPPVARLHVGSVVDLPTPGPDLCHMRETVR